MAALFVAAMFVAAHARAQDDTGGGDGSEPNANAVALAREQFRLGLEAAEAGNWEAARVAFDRSYRLAPRPITLLNLAGAQAQTAHYVQAAESYRQFRQEATGRAAREIPGAEEALAAVEQRIAHVRVEITHLASRDVVTVDGVEVQHVALGVDMPVDPGDHQIVVSRAGTQIGAASFHADEGERVSEAVTIALPVAPVDSGDEGDGPHRRGGHSLFEDPVFWGVAGGIAAAVIVGVIIIVVVASSGPSPFTGNLGLQEVM